MTSGFELLTNKANRSCKTLQFFLYRANQLPLLPSPVHTSQHINKPFGVASWMLKSLFFT